MEDLARDDAAINFDPHYLEHCGESGREWLLEVRRPDRLRLFSAIEEALLLVRERSLERSFEIFAEVEAAAVQEETRSLGIACLLRRHLYAARAYGFYLKNELEAAERDLALAYESLRILLGLHPYLCPKAMGFTDFLIQRARMARRQNRWKEAQECLDELRGIYRGTVAFCTLQSGRELFIGEIRALGQSLNLSEEQHDWFRRLIGDKTDIEILVDAIEATVYTLPDQVIPYHPQ